MSKTEFPATKAYAKIHGFLLDIDTSIRKGEQRSNVQVLSILDTIDRMIHTTELEEEKDRFANPALKKLHASLHELDTGLDSDVYLKNSFGNATRLDYGTGHELNFLCFMYTLVSQDIANTNEVFLCLRRYFQVVRSLILRFNVEPAGSHGLWGLDDYQFLPFLLGSSELHNSACVLDNLRDSCYKEAVEFVKKTKGKGGMPIELIAPKLYSMRNLKWNEVNARLFRMYNESVLRSSVVYQHFIYTKYLERDSP